MTPHPITLPRRATGWTHGRLALAVALWLAGRSAREIAAELGDTTRNAVIGQLRRLGYIGRPGATVRRKPGAWAIWSGALNRRRAWRAAR